MSSVPAPELKPAIELAKMQIEPGDTTHMPTMIPSELGKPIKEATSEDETPEYKAQKIANAAAHEAAAIKAAMHRVYKSTIDTTYIFKDGTYAIFRGKRYLTANITEIAELDKEIVQLKNPFLFIDANEKEADPTLEDPTEKLKAKLFAEWAEQLARAMNPDQDAGSTQTQKINPASSTGIQSVAAGAGPSQSVSTQMANLLAKIKGSKQS